MNTTTNWSPYQDAIFAAVVARKSNLVIKAAAGSGKTTTLVQAIRNALGDSIFLAFNKSIAEELKSRGVNARTFHSLTYSPVTRARGARNVEADKVRNHLRDSLAPADAKLYAAFVAKLVGLAKNAGIGCLIEDAEDNWTALAERHDLELESDKADYAHAIQLARDTLRWSNADGTGGDFDDLLYFAVKDGIVLPRFDNIFVDEAQDTNAIQRAILRKLLKPGSMLVAVGDDAQAIYGFRGADSDALQLIADEFNAQTLPLTVSYRCGNQIVKHAQAYGEIEAAPGAIDGTVRTQSLKDSLTELGAKDLVVSRTTKPLIEAAYSLLKARKPAYVMGREIGAGLVSLIRKLNAKGIDHLTQKLDAFTAREVQKAIAKGQDSKAEAIQDKSDCIAFLIDTLPETDRTVPALIKVIEDLFTDKNGSAVVLATVHKAKGLEARRVFWLNHDYVCRWARQDWQKQQERNLSYVAATRAKEELVLIPTPARGAVERQEAA
jgi:DNA helicase-2/ATP-dependent DNA helicase PcrA